MSYHNTPFVPFKGVSLSFLSLSHSKYSLILFWKKLTFQEMCNLPLFNTIHLLLDYSTEKIGDTLNWTEGVLNYSNKFRLCSKGVSNKYPVLWDYWYRSSAGPLRHP